VATDRTSTVSPADARREYDGEGRVPWLPCARSLSWAPPAPAADAAEQEPIYVWIEWTPGTVERPLPGSCLWRAALARIADRVPAAAPVIEDELRRFPDFESWLYWRDRERRPSATPTRVQVPRLLLRWPW
jgi:hypothetical protein